MPAEKTAAVPRRSRVKRFLLWCGASMFVLLLLLAGAVWWLWSHRMEYINRIISDLGTVRGNVGDVSLTNDGALMSGFELRDAKTDDVLLRLPQVVVNSGVRELMARHIKLATVNDAEISISEPFLEKLLDQRGDDDDSSVVTLPAGWKIDRIELLNARLQYNERDGTHEEIVANFRADDISTDAEGDLYMGEQTLTITAGGIARSGSAPVSLESLRAHGRVHDGVVDLDEVIITNPEVALTPEFLDFLTPDSPSQKQPDQPEKKPSAKKRIARSFVHAVRIGSFKCDSIELSASGFTPGNIAGIELPELKARVSYQTTDFEWSEDEALSPGTQWLRIEHLDLKPPEGGGSIKCRSLNITAQPPKDGRWTVESCLIREPEVAWTPELRKLLLPAKEKTVTDAGDATPATNAVGSLLVQSADVRDARVSFVDAELVPFELRGGFTLSARDLIVDEKGAHSKEAQSLDLKDVALGFAGKKEFFSLARGEFTIKPDAWNESRAIEKLALTQPVLRMRDSNTPWFITAAANQATDQAAVTTGKANDGPPLWQQVHFGVLAVSEGAIDFAENQNGHVLDAQAKLTVTTDGTKPGLHRVKFEEFEARLPGLTLFPFPVARVSYVEGAAALPDVWKNHRVESLRIGGATIEASEALMKFFEPPASAAGDLKSETGDSKTTAPQRGPKPKSEPEWIVGDFNIADSQVTLDRLVPGMDSVKFDVSLDIKDAPLSPEGLAEDVAGQRVELANLLVPSPYGGPPVAKLDSVFVSFSPAGLIKKHIDKVEIVSPTLYIGEPLFWYVDFYRKFADNSAKKSETKIASADHLFALEAATAVVANAPKMSEAGWDVRTLAVHSGKLVLAPKGVPLAGFRTPFPFSFTSEVTRGTLEADFEIPSDNYELPDIKLAFEGLSGKVQFNLPVKNKDNNVTETFNVKRIRWKEMHIEDAFLTVTYDAAGIYGKFGGHAYEGYVNGEFNIYLDDVYSWDGWISGKDVQTREITRKLFPGYFFMEGKVGAHVVAVGDGKEVYQADGKFENQTPGKLSIEALNDLIKKLPENLSGIKQQLTQITLETLRDFAYDRADGNFRTYGREGRGTLKFTGPTGTRSFEINAYDHRWKVDPPPDKAATVTTQTTP